VFLSNELSVAVQSGASSYSLLTRVVTDFTTVACTKGTKIDIVQGTVRQTKHCNENAVTLFAYGAEERWIQGFDRET
jgi:hypothetical protein